MRRWLEDYWLAPVPAVRGWIVLRTFMLLFAFDAIADHLRPAWRYGTAGFNVAHARALELLPAPTTELYVGAMFVLAIASFVVALAPRAPRVLMGVIAVVYFWSWSSSMHDSYQHHYLLSLLFLAFTFLPPLSSWDLFGAPGALAATPVDAKRGKTKPAATTPIPGLRELTIAFVVVVIGAAVLYAAWASGTSLALGALVLTAGIGAMTWTCHRAQREGALDAALPHSLVPRASAWSMPLVWVTAAVVYAYTAVSKTEPEWRDGAALRDITRNGARIPEAVDFFAMFGIEGDALWTFLGHSVIALQIACALGYATAALRDRARGPLRVVLDAIALVALLLALSFHLGAEYMGLQIGWFSWYMILLAIATFAPASMLSAGVMLFTWPLRELRERRAEDASPPMAAVLALIAGALLLPVGMDADLPGALGACVLVGVALLGAGLYVTLRREHAAEVRNAAIAVALAALMIPFSLRVLGGDDEIGRDGRPAPHHDVRYDYWRFAGGDFRRRGEWALALDAYVHANRHAPARENREEQEREMRERVRTEGPRREER
ncbi:HTTM domain-containing protein [Sandaracinus amylolyticus]|nr:HTTM domain-containing protein [Sandaracinus amylolyticus]